MIQSPQDECWVQIEVINCHASLVALGAFQLLLERVCCSASCPCRKHLHLSCDQLDSKVRDEGLVEIGAILQLIELLASLGDGTPQICGWSIPRVLLNGPTPLINNNTIIPDSVNQL